MTYHRTDISPALLRRLLRYEPKTGRLFWLQRGPEHFSSRRACSVWNARYAGNEAFTALLRGYLTGRIFDQHYAAHRVAWALHYGAWPSHVDHINGCRGDNRIENLRSVAQAENNRNCRQSRSNKSGCTGVWQHPQTGAWTAFIGRNGGRVHLGSYRRRQDAVRARRAAEAELGYHPNHGRRA